jgi:O-antigen/teichoic acid export membrane protein
MAALIARLKGLASNDFIRSVGVLVGGTAAAQVLMAVSLPIATRLYSPTDFSLLALFTAIVSIISVSACLRFDIAVPIPESDEEAANVLALAVGFAVLVSAVLALLAIFAPGPIVRLLNRPDFRPYLWLVPLTVLLSGLFSTLQYWFVRRKSFRAIATTKMGQATGASATLVGLGFAHPTPLGLLLAYAINSGAGFIGLSYRFLRTDVALLRQVSWQRMKHAFAANSRFPKYSTFEAACNSASIYLPIILISSLAAGPEAGYVIVAIQVMQAPMSLIGSAIAQVYLSRAPEEFRADNLGAFTASIFSGLLKTGVGPLIFGGIVAPEVFSLVFGQGWRPAGELVLWMTPWFVAQFLSSPLSMALHVTGNQRLALCLQIFGLIVRAGSIYAAYLVFPKYLSETYAISGFIFYSVYNYGIFKITNTSLRSLYDALFKSSPLLLGWILIAVSFKVVVVYIW